MISPPAVVCFLIWIVYGVYELRRLKSISLWAGKLSAGTRAAMGSGLFLGGACFLFATLAIVVGSVGPRATGLAPWHWALVALAGMIFAKAQIYGAVLLFSLTQTEFGAREAVVTKEPPKSSDSS